MNEPQFHLPANAIIGRERMSDGTSIRTLLLPHDRPVSNLLLLTGRAEADGFNRLVLRAGLARALRSLPDLTLVDVAVALDEKTLRAVRIEVSALYGTDLAVLADHVRTQALAVIRDVVGDATDVDVDVAITDVHR